MTPSPRFSYLVNPRRSRFLFESWDFSLSGDQLPAMLGALIARLQGLPVSGCLVQRVALHGLDPLEALARWLALVIQDFVVVGGHVLLLFRSHERAARTPDPSASSRALGRALPSTGHAVSSSSTEAMSWLIRIRGGWDFDHQTRPVVARSCPSPPWHRRARCCRGGASACEASRVIRDRPCRGASASGSLWLETG